MNARSLLAAGFLVMLGSLQMLADLAQWTQVKAVAAALQVAPAMEVFTAHQGYETHAARFHLSWMDRSGTQQTLALDPRWLRKWMPQCDAVLLFDGDCALCNGCVRLVVAEERNGRLRFAPLESAVGVRLLEGIERDWRGDSVVLLQTGRALSKSRAVAAVLEYCGGSWFLLGRLLRVIPRPIADAGYDLMGHLRYRIAGRSTVCANLPASRVAAALQVDGTPG